MNFHEVFPLLMSVGVVVFAIQVCIFVFLACKRMKKDMRDK